MKVAVSGHSSLLRAAFAVLLVVDRRVERSFHDTTFHFRPQNTLQIICVNFNVCFDIGFA